MHQIWHNHQFSQKSKTTKRAVLVEVGGNITKFENGGGEVGNIGEGLHKIGGLGTLCQLLVQSCCHLFYIDWQA